MTADKVMQDNSNPNLLSINNLSIGFQLERDFFWAVDDISFNINRGECVGIVGESGCGKSITSMSIVKLLPIPPAKITGEIIFNGKNINNISQNELHKIRGKEVGIVFQEPMTSINPTMTIGKQVSEIIKTHEPGISKVKLKERVINLIDKVGIPHSKER